MGGAFTAHFMSQQASFRNYEESLAYAVTKAGKD